MNLRSSNIGRVVREFNRMHAPECLAKVRRKKGNFLEVEFSGTKAGFACCFDENFIDFAYYVKDMMGWDLKIKKLERLPHDRFLVEYEVWRET